MLHRPPSQETALQEEQNTRCHLREAVTGKIRGTKLAKSGPRGPLP